MQTQRIDLWTQRGKERVGQIYRVALKHTVLYVKQIIKGKVQCNTGSLAQCSVTTWTGGLGGSEGGDIRIPVAGSQVYRDQHNTVKQLFSNEK